jgi:hydroxymethylbilane synthase
MVRRLLAEAHGIGEDRIEVVVIRTTGDAIQDRPLSESGGKGLFTKELDAALLEGSIDLAVHSSKDLPTVLPDGLCVTGYLPREDVRDCLISARFGSLEALPKGAVIGTASLRRAALIKRLRPDLETTLLRGNVETRLRKTAEGEVDATLLALAGLKRLGLERHATMVMPIDVFPPAVGQGAIAITARASDVPVAAMVRGVSDDETGTALAAERAFLTVLDGSCRTPIAGYATVSDGMVQFRGMLLRVDGSEVFETQCSGPSQEAVALGARAGREILSRAPADVLSHSG